MAISDLRLAAPKLTISVRGRQRRVDQLRRSPGAVKFTKQNATFSRHSCGI